MAEQFLNKPETNNYPEELTPEQLERARERIRQEEQTVAQEFSAAREEQAKKQALERNKKSDLVEPPADIPGITRPEVPQAPLNPITELNEGLARGEAEKRLKEVMAGKQDHGGPEHWTNTIAALQESDTDDE